MGYGYYFNNYGIIFIAYLSLFQENLKHLLYQRY